MEVIKVVEAFDEAPTSSGDELSVALLCGVLDPVLPEGSENLGWR